MVKLLVDTAMYQQKPASAEIGTITNSIFCNLEQRTKEGTPSQIAKSVERGRTICCSVLEGDKDPKQNGYKQIEHFKEQQLFFIDIDNDEKINGDKFVRSKPLSIEDAKEICKNWGLNPCLIYESYSSRTFDSKGEMFCKYHILFASDVAVTDVETVKHIEQSLLWIFKCDTAYTDEKTGKINYNGYGDEQCKDIGRFLFGTKKDTPSRIAFIDDNAVNTVEQLLKGYEEEQQHKKHVEELAKLIAELKAEEKEAHKQHKEFKDVDIEKALQFISSDRPRDEWIEISGCYKKFGGDFSTWRTWSERGNYDGKENLETVWAGLDGGGTDKATLVYFARNDNPGNVQAINADLYGYDKDKTYYAEESKKETFTIGLLKKAMKKADFVPSYNIITRLLELTPKSREKLQLDIYSDSATKNFFTAIYAISKKEFKKVNKDDIRDYVIYIVQTDSTKCYNPVLKALEEWTEGKDLDTIYNDSAPLDELYELMHITDSLAKKLIKKWLMQCISLQFNGKCGNFGGEGVLVLNGNQGIGKSLLAEKLGSAFDDFSTISLYGTGIIIPDNKDTIIQGTQSFIYELAEVEHNFRKADAESFKSFITQKLDDVRAPYERQSERHLRHTSYIATCNSDDYLKDTTGNRRFWTIQCDRRFNIDKLKTADFKDLWKYIYSCVQLEGVQAFRLTTEEIEELENVNAEHVAKIRGQQEIEDILTYVEKKANLYKWQYTTISTFASQHTSLKKYDSATVGKALRQVLKQRGAKTEEKTIRVQGNPRRTMWLPMLIAMATNTEIPQEQPLEEEEEKIELPF